MQTARKKEFYNQNVRGKRYDVGDAVMLHEPAVPRGRCRKFHRPCKGPWRVVRVLGPSVYRIQDCACPRRKVVHFNRLKPAVSTGELQHAIPKKDPPLMTTSSATPNSDPCNDYDFDDYDVSVLPSFNHQPIRQA